MLTIFKKKCCWVSDGTLPPGALHTPDSRSGSLNQRGQRHRRMSQLWPKPMLLHWPDTKKSIEGNIRLDASYAMPINLIRSNIFARVLRFMLWFPELLILSHYVKTYYGTINISYYKLDISIRLLQSCTIYKIQHIFTLTNTFINLLKHILINNIIEQ